MKLGETVRVYVDVDTHGDAMDLTVPYTVRDVLGDSVYVQRVDEAWFANEYEWCVRTVDVRRWVHTRGVA